MNKKIKAFIIFSVMLNVLFIGLAVGFVFKHQNHERHDESIAQILENKQLPEDKRALMEKEITAILDKSRITRGEIEKMRELTFKILTAEEFDESAYTTQINNIGVMRNQQRQDMSEAIKALAKQLNVRERTVLAEILKDNPRGMKSKQGYDKL
jgi:uncharacterized membrane protein